MTASQVWAGIDVGKEDHWVCVVDDKGKVMLSRKLVNDEQPIRALVAEVDELSRSGDLDGGPDHRVRQPAADRARRHRQLGALSRGRAVWQASGTYRGGEAKTDAKDAGSSPTSPGCVAPICRCCIPTTT